VKKCFCADGTELICVTLTDFSLQPLTAKLVLLQDSSGDIVVITVKIGQGFFLVLPFIFDIVSSTFHTHLHAAVINTTSGRGLETVKWKKKTLFCKWVMLERKVLVFISAANLIPVITGGE
jgi:hypothetical protein